MQILIDQKYLVHTDDLPPGSFFFKAINEPSKCLHEFPYKINVPSIAADRRWFISYANKIRKYHRQYLLYCTEILAKHHTSAYFPSIDPKFALIISERCYKTAKISWNCNSWVCWFLLIKSSYYQSVENEDVYHFDRMHCRCSCSTYWRQSNNGFEIGQRC